MRFMSTEKDYEVVKVAKLTPKMVDVKELTVGEVGSCYWFDKVHPGLLELVTQLPMLPNLQGASSKFPRV